MRLAPNLLLEYQAGETPWSYCSRLGFRIGVGGRIFAQHCGTNLRALAFGQEDALSKLAVVAEVDVALLRAAAPIRITTKRTLMFGEVLTVPLLSRRTEIRYCPVCVAEQNGSVGRHVLTEWLVLPITVCRHHSTRLHTTHAREQSALDQAPLLEEIANAISGETIVHQYARALELHLLARLDGTAEDTWLFKMPLYALVGLSVAIGRTRIGGNQDSTSNMTMDDRHSAACLGFEILEGEEETILEYLQIQDEITRIDAKYKSPNNAYGDLYKFLCFNFNDKSFDHFRRIMDGHIQKNYPDRGTSFGRPTVPRKLRSLKALADFSGIEAHRIRVLAKTEGYLAPRPKGTRGRTVLSLTAADTIISTLRDGCTPNQLRSILGASPNQIRALIELGLIQPVGWRKNKQLFSRSAATKILARVASQLAGGSSSSTEILESVTNSRIEQIVSDGDLLKLILGKKLKMLASSADGAKLASLLVSRPELIGITGNEFRGLFVHQVAKRLKIGRRTWSELCQNGHLPGPSIPIRHAHLTAISDVEEFERRYVSLGQIAHKLGVSVKRASVLLKQADVQPLTLPSKTRSVFERAIVEATFPQLQ